MNHQKQCRFIKQSVVLFSVMILTVLLAVPVVAEESSPPDSSEFVTCVKGYSESVEKDLLSREDAVQAYPYYETDLDITSRSVMRWKVVYGTNEYIDTYKLIGKEGLGSHEKISDFHKDQPPSHLIDFDKAESEFAALGDVSNVYIVDSNPISANLVFGTVNGKEYAVPFCYRGATQWSFLYETGKIYPAEDIISMVEQRTQSGPKYQPLIDIEKVRQTIADIFVELGIVPVLIAIGVIMVIGIIAIVRMNKKQAEMEEDEKQAKIGE